MDGMMLDDLRYRIQNLKAVEQALVVSIEDHKMRRDLGDVSEYDGWDCGYAEGRLMSIQSELRFLQGLIKVAV